MESNRAVLAVAVVAVTVIATAGVATALAPAQTDGTAQQIRASATGEVSAQPDQAVLQIAVVATADDAATARNRVATNATALRSTLAELGVPDDRIKTVYYNIGEAHERFKGQEPTSYRAAHAFKITLTDTDRVGTVIDRVVDSGANRVRGVSFTLSDETRRELRQEALRNAMERARTEAETLATSANLSIDGAASISTNDVSVVPYRVERTMVADAGGASTTIESSPVNVRASVQVVYNASAA